jgi:hypothetical protein
MTSHSSTVQHTVVAGAGNVELSASPVQRHRPKTRGIFWFSLSCVSAALPMFCGTLHDRSADVH